MTCKPLRSFIIFIIVIFCNSYAFAQAIDSTSVTDSTIADSSGTTAVVDSAANDDDAANDTVIAQASFKNGEDSILKWKKGSEFAYMVYLDSMLKKRKDLRQDTMDVDDNNVTKRKSSSVSSNDSGSDSGIFMNSGPVKIFFWALAIFFILFILYRLFFKNNLFARQKIIKQDDVQEEPQSLNEFSAYYSLINDAEKNNNYNLAIRYLYLQSLRMLAEKEVIVFMQDKTNYDYVRELAGRAFQPSFARLTNSYEYAWYGKMNINKNAYDGIKENFTAFNKTL